MTASGPGVPGRGSSTDNTPRRGIGREIALILGIGLIARLVLAYGIPPFFPSPIAGSGFGTDLNLFRYWADSLAQHGPFGFYDRGFFADYTPGYLYALWLVGIVGSFIGGIGDLIKLPAIITDVVLAWVVYKMVLELGVTERRARLAALVVVANPITWFDSVVWGQVDSFGAVFLLLAVRELWRDRGERAAILAMMAALVKPQLAILVPIVAVVVIRRALWPAGGFGDEEPPEVAGTRWERRTSGPLRILTTGVAGLLTAVALCLPFGLPLIAVEGTSLVKLMLSTASTYPYVSVNAYNAWAMFPVDGSSIAINSQWVYDSAAKDAVAWATFGPIPAAVLGAAGLLTLAGIITLIVGRRPDRLTILVGTCALALAFFGVPTRVHERYLFPLFGLAGILIAFSWRWRIAYLLASVATFLNMYVVLTTLYPGCGMANVDYCNPGIADWLGIGSAIRSFWGVAFVAALNVAVLLWGLAQLRHGAARTLAHELEGGRRGADADVEEGAYDEDLADDLPDEERIGLPVAVAAAAAAAEDVAHGFVPAATASPHTAASPPPPPRSRGRGALVPAWFDRPSLGALGPIGWFRAKVAETPIRPDRSASLASEKGGRPDRLDWWVIIVIVIASLCLRGYRLEEPARMHFDEVYHARTATEFLQYWRYGISHNIYEWTHPHFAKYMMAGGIVAFAGHDVAASSQLEVPVVAAAIEPRFADPTSATARDGDRVWVVTGSELRAYDLQTRSLEASWPIADAVAVTVDTSSHTVTVGTMAGSLVTVDATSLDQVRAGVKGAAPSALTQLATIDAEPAELLAWDSGSRVAVRSPDGTIRMVDANTGEVVGSAVLAGAAAMADMGDGDVVEVTFDKVSDPATTAATLAGITGGDASAYERVLAQTGSDTAVLDITLDATLRTDLQKAIDDGKLPGITIGKAPLLAVSDGSGVSMLADNAVIADAVDIEGGTFGLANITGLGSGNQLYASSRSAETQKPQITIIATSGDPAKSGPSITSSMEMPGDVTSVGYDSASQMVEALGVTQDTGDPTIYVIEPHGNAVFADHQLASTPTAWVIDHNEDYPGSSRGEILAFSGQGEVASLDIGHYDFAWRLPGVIFGALMAAAVYLLTRVLFRRRSVALLAGLFVVLDGMMFVQSRIGMNDVYVGFFIIAAYALFAWLWVEDRPRRWFWALMPVIGVLLGLGLGSKWVAAYAIGALGILVLARSALGRVLLILGMIGITAVLGWMALAVPEGSVAFGNVIFPMIMICLTLATVAITVYRPIAWSDDEIRFTVAGPVAAGALLALAAIALGKTDKAITFSGLSVTPIALAFALVVLGGVLYAAMGIAARFGFGPMAPRDPEHPREDVAPPPNGWLRLGDGLGLSTAWWAICLIGIPLVVYVALYLPWAYIDNHQLWVGFPAGNTGQTLIDLTGSMYRYHNDLTSAHPASSPWWAWPMNLKPVWFYQGSFANDTGAAIYDAGTMAIWWLSIPAMAFVAYKAFQRRSVALALIFIAFLAQWISWSRIDRAAFQYHYYTSLPFVIIALAYFVAEIWHGASRRAWLLARVAAAFAVMGPALLWLLRLPLCKIANVESVNKGSQACNGNPGNLVVTPSVAAMVVVLLVGGGILVWQLVNLSRPREDGRSATARDTAPLLITGVLVVAAALFTRTLPSEDPLLSINGLAPEPIALLALIPLGLVASQIVMARDARRFVGGLLAAIGINFLVLYPNISALPMPSSILPWYQGVLPTYLYPFQFGVSSLDRSGGVVFRDMRFAVLVAFLVMASCAVAYSAWTWRQASLAEAREVAAPGAAGASGPGGDGDDPGGAADAHDEGRGDDAGAGQEGVWPNEPAHPLADPLADPQAPYGAESPPGGA